MDYTERLRQAAQESGIACMGLDPVLERIPIQGPAEDVLCKFFLGILEAIKDTRLNTVKPNMAYFEQHGLAGLRALKRIIEGYRKAGYIVILDSKRADIGPSSEAYAKAMFDFWEADAVTVPPYMGHDSIEPFLRYSKKGKGVYMLCRTSNPGAKDFQDLESKGLKLFMHVARKAVSWKAEGLGLVAGATYPKELEGLCSTIAGHGMPLLIPGVGSQGGDAKNAVRILKKSGMDIGLARINSSSGILYSFREGEDYAEAAAREIKKMDRDIGKL